MNNSNFFTAENLEQLRHQHALAEGDADLYSQRVKATQKRGRAERRFIKTVGASLFPNPTKEQERALNQYLKAHHDESEAMRFVEGLELHRKQSTVALLRTTIEEYEKKMKEQAAQEFGLRPPTVIIPGTR